MTNQQKNNFFVITGAPGSGKSTILKQLRILGIKIVNEVAREIIDEQRIINGKGLYDQDKFLFVELMLSSLIIQYRNMIKENVPIIFDRAIPDNIGYASLFGVDVSTSINAAHNFRYNKSVFYTPPWEKIYTTDEDRKLSFEEAESFGEIIKNEYLELGYEIIEIPLDTPSNRAKFVINKIFDICCVDNPLNP